MKTLLIMMMTLLFNAASGATLGPVLGLSPMAGSVIGVALGFVPSGAGNGLMAGVLKEIWTGELVKQFRHDGSFLSVIRGRDELVDNDAIHLVDVGADPAVLINNSTYPISVVSRDDDDIVIKLDKFDTENTRIKRDELYAITYDKVGSVVEQHNEVLEEKTVEKSLHALAPASDTKGTPVIETTGAANGTVKRATIADFVKMKRRFDDAKVPKMNRHVVLSNEHVEDLLTTNESFEKQYMDIREGKVLKIHGFQVHECTYNPTYNAGSKEAFGAVPTGGSRNASVFFYAPRAFKARGTVEMFYKDASENPEYRETVAGFQLYYICLPKKWEGFGALVSATV